MSNIADKLTDEFVGYAVDIERYSAGVQKDVVQILRRAEKEMVQTLTDINPTGALQPSYRELRLKKVLGETQQIIGKGYSEASSTTTNSLRSLASIESEVPAKLINSSIGVDLAGPGLSPESLQRIVSNTLIEGAPSKEWWSRQGSKLQQRFSDQVKLGMVQQESLDDIVRRVRGTATGRRVSYRASDGSLKFMSEFKGGIMEVSTREARALVRTSVQAVSQNARMDLYKKNKDIVNGVQAVVTLDGRTSDLCMSRSGFAWDMEGKPLAGTGTSESFPGPPPWHFQCRSTLVPVLPSFNKLSKNKKIKDKVVKIPRGTQSSMDGQVAANLTYESWLKNKSEPFQKQVLGHGRWKLWKEDKLSLRQLVDQTGNSLNLRQLRSKLGLKSFAKGLSRSSPRRVFSVDQLSADDVMSAMKFLNKAYRHYRSYHAAKYAVKDVILGGGYKDYLKFLNVLRDFAPNYKGEMFMASSFKKAPLGVGDIIGGKAPGIFVKSVDQVKGALGEAKHAVLIRVKAAENAIGFDLSDVGKFIGDQHIIVPDNINFKIVGINKGIHIPGFDLRDGVEYIVEPVKKGIKSAKEVKASTYNALNKILDKERAKLVKAKIDAQRKVVDTRIEEIKRQIDNIIKSDGSEGVSAKKFFTKKFRVESFTKYKDTDPVNLFMKTKGLDIDDVAKNVLGRDASYSNVRVFASKKNQITFHARGVEGRFFKIKKTIFKSSERHVMDISRTFFLDKNGVVVNVRHDYLYLKKSSQSLGVAKNLLSDSFNQYRKLGVQRVTLAAENVGSYAWARYGFSPINRRTFNRAVNSRLKKLVETDLFKSKVRGHQAEILRDLRTIILKSTDDEVANLIASYTNKGEKVGKEVMMKLRWRAKFDLNNPHSRKVFNDYVKTDTFIPLAASEFPGKQSRIAALRQKLEDALKNRQELRSKKAAIRAEKKVLRQQMKEAEEGLANASLKSRTILKVYPSDVKGTNIVVNQKQNVKLRGDLEKKGLTLEEVAMRIAGVDGKDNLVSNVRTVVTPRGDLLIEASSSNKAIVRIVSDIQFRNKTVVHNLVQLRAGFQGKGIAKKLLRESIDLYQKMGIEKVTLHAGREVGGYAWVRYGFKPTQKSWDKIRKGALRKKLKILSTNANDATAIKDLGRLLDNPKPETMRVIANYADPDGRRLGKDLLLLTYWDGVLDLTDERSMRIFNSYVNRDTLFKPLAPSASSVQIQSRLAAMREALEEKLSDIKIGKRLDKVHAEQVTELSLSDARKSSLGKVTAASSADELENIDKFKKDVGTSISNYDRTVKDQINSNFRGTGSAAKNDELLKTLKEGGVDDIEGTTGKLKVSVGSGNTNYRIDPDSLNPTIQLEKAVTKDPARALNFRHEFGHYVSQTVSGRGAKGLDLDYERVLNRSGIDIRNPYIPHSASAMDHLEDDLGKLVLDKKSIKEHTKKIDDFISKEYLSDIKINALIGDDDSVRQLAGQLLKDADDITGRAGHGKVVSGMFSEDDVFAMLTRKIDGDVVDNKKVVQGIMRIAKGVELKSPEHSLEAMIRLLNMLDDDVQRYGDVTKDLFGSLTNLRVGGGHSPGYYSKFDKLKFKSAPKGFAADEISILNIDEGFADYYAIRYGKSANAMRTKKLTEIFFPKTMEKFDDIVDRVAHKGVPTKKVVIKKAHVDEIVSEVRKDITQKAASDLFEAQAASESPLTTLNEARKSIVGKFTRESSEKVSKKKSPIAVFKKDIKLTAEKYERKVKNMIKDTFKGTDSDFKNKELLKIFDEGSADDLKGAGTGKLELRKIEALTGEAYYTPKTDTGRRPGISMKRGIQSIDIFNLKSTTFRHEYGHFVSDAVAHNAKKLDKDFKRIANRGFFSPGEEYGVYSISALDHIGEDLSKLVLRSDLVKKSTADIDNFIVKEYFERPKIKGLLSSGDNIEELATQLLKDADDITEKAGHGRLMSKIFTREEVIGALKFGDPAYHAEHFMRVAKGIELKNPDIALKSMYDLGIAVDNTLLIKPQASAYHTTAGDLFASLTNNRVGNGHSIEYYAQGTPLKFKRFSKPSGFKITELTDSNTDEAFAQYFTLRYGKDRLASKYTKLSEAFFPRTMSKFDDIVDRVANKGIPTKPSVIKQAHLDEIVEEVRDQVKKEAFEILDAVESPLMSLKDARSAAVKSLLKNPSRDEIPRANLFKLNVKNVADKYDSRVQKEIRKSFDATDSDFKNAELLKIVQQGDADDLLGPGTGKLKGKSSQFANYYSAPDFQKGFRPNIAVASLQGADRGRSFMHEFGHFVSNAVSAPHAKLTDPDYVRVLNRSAKNIKGINTNYSSAALDYLADDLNDMVLMGDEIVKITDKVDRFSFGYQASEKIQTLISNKNLDELVKVAMKDADDILEKAGHGRVMAQLFNEEELLKFMSKVTPDNGIRRFISIAKSIELKNPTTALEQLEALHGRINIRLIPKANYFYLVDDLFGSLTNLTVGKGHSSAYYKESNRLYFKWGKQPKGFAAGEMRESHLDEGFAQFFALRYGPGHDPKRFTKFAEIFFPRTMGKFEDMVDRVANKGVPTQRAVIKKSHIAEVVEEVREEVTNSLAEIQKKTDPIIMTLKEAKDSVLGKLTRQSVVSDLDKAKVFKKDIESSLGGYNSKMKRAIKGSFKGTDSDFKNKELSKLLGEGGDDHFIGPEKGGKVNLKTTSSGSNYQIADADKRKVASISINIADKLSNQKDLIFRREYGHYVSRTVSAPKARLLDPDYTRILGRSDIEYLSIDHPNTYSVAALDHLGDDLGELVLRKKFIKEASDVGDKYIFEKYIEGSKIKKLIGDSDLTDDLIKQLLKDADDITEKAGHGRLLSQLFSGDDLAKLTGNTPRTIVVEVMRIAKAIELKNPQAALDAMKALSKGAKGILPPQNYHELMSDFFGALTNNRVGHGHSAAYYKRGDKIRFKPLSIPKGFKGEELTTFNLDEGFANYFSMRYGKSVDATRYTKLAETFLPKTTGKFDDMLHRVAHKGAPEKAIKESMMRSFLDTVNEQNIKDAYSIKKVADALVKKLKGLTDEIRKKTAGEVKTFKPIKPSEAPSRYMRQPPDDVILTRNNDIGLDKHKAVQIREILRDSGMTIEEAALRVTGSNTLGKHGTKRIIATITNDGFEVHGGYPGEAISELIRKINLRSKKATHINFKVNNLYQGQGVATRVLREAIDAYKQLGVKRVEIPAAIGPGSYAWTRFGFLQKLDDWKSLRDSLISDLEHVNFRKQLGISMKDSFILKRIAQFDDPEMLRVIADYKGSSGKHLGRDLLSKHYMWGGELDLNDLRSMKRFDAYVDRPFSPLAPSEAPIKVAAEVKKLDLKGASRRRQEKYLLDDDNFDEIELWPKFKRAGKPVDIAMRNNKLDQTMDKVFGKRVKTRKESLRKVVADDNVRIYLNLFEDDLMGVIKDNKIRNALETDLSTFTEHASQSGFRGKLEKEVFGIRESATKSNLDNYPKYGYLGDQKVIGFVDDVPFLQHYGDIRIKFKQRIKSRSTFIIGDSLNNNAPYNMGIASPFNDPDPDSLKAIFSDRLVYNHKQKGFVDRETLAPAAKSKNLKPNLDKISLEGKKFIDEPNLENLVKVTQPGYVEAQIFGKVTLDEVDSLYVPDKLANNIKQKLVSAGYGDIKVISKRTNTEEILNVEKKIAQAEKRLSGIAKTQDAMDAQASKDKTTKSLLKKHLDDLEDKINKFKPRAEDKPKFKPIGPSEAPSRKGSRQYSSAERLVKQQRPSDVRTGKQWNEYLISKGISEIELNISLLVDLFRDNPDTVVSAAAVLQRLWDNMPNSYSVVVNSKFPVKTVTVRWDNVTPEERKITRSARESLLDEFGGGNDFVVVNKSTSNLNLPEGNYQSRFKSFEVDIVKLTKSKEDSYVAVFINRNTGRVEIARPPAGGPWPKQGYVSESDAMHAAQKIVDDANNPNNRNRGDWRSLTVENKYLIDSAPSNVKNYKEVVVAVPNLRRVRAGQAYEEADHVLDSHFNDRVQISGVPNKEAAVHYRSTDYKIKGEKYLLIQEIQSDFFQNVEESLRKGSSDRYKRFREKTPYAGTSNWVALAFRHALESVVDEGDYKGIAWLDGRRQTQLEHDFDPENLTTIPNYAARSVIVSTKLIKNGDFTAVRGPTTTLGINVIETKHNKNFLKMLEDGGTFIEMDDARLHGQLMSVEIEGKKTNLFEGVDFIRAVAGIDANYYAFRKGIFSDKDLYSGNSLKGSVHFIAQRKNIFAVFQDRIVTGAISKQMKRNGINTKITHDKDLGFHIMPIDEKSQKLIKENGQPMYSKAVPGTDFRPIPASDSPNTLLREIKEAKRELDEAVREKEKAKGIEKETKVLTSQLEDLEKKVAKFSPLAPSEAHAIKRPVEYSSLERLIKSQRDSDVRNGEQWIKYLTSQNMSQAEMKNTGVWALLEKSKKRKVSKERLVKVIGKKAVKVDSILVQAEDWNVVHLEWDDIDHKLGDVAVMNSLLEELDKAGQRNPQKYTYGVVKSTSHDTIDGDELEAYVIKVTTDKGKVSYATSIYGDGMTPRISTGHNTASDALHDVDRGLQDMLRYDEALNEGTDWRSITAEHQGLLKDQGKDYRDLDQLANYQERLVLVPGLEGYSTRGLKNTAEIQMVNDRLSSAAGSLSHHFRKSLTRYSGQVDTSYENFDITDIAAHVRTTDYEIDGSKYLLIQEIQSDYFQELQKLRGTEMGDRVYKNFVENTPYAGSNHWVALAFRHALDGAVNDGGYKGVAWLDGKLASELENSNLKLFQDKIVTEAIRKQMRNNGVTPIIKHNKELGFHVMDIDEKSQLLIKEKGQPSYAKAIPDPDFKPLDASESFNRTRITPNQYSSLERLIENQRPLDKRNGKQWIKYLIGQDMSEAEMKHTGVWDELQRSKTKEITKETLLATLNRNRFEVTSYEGQTVFYETKTFNWKGDGVREEITDTDHHIYTLVNRKKTVPSKISIVQSSEDDKYKVIKIVDGDEVIYKVYYDASLRPSSFNTVSDAMHSVELDFNLELSDRGQRDWRSTTIEGQGIIKGHAESLKNYREVLITIPQLASDNLSGYTLDLESKVRNRLHFHFDTATDRIRKNFPDNEVWLTDIVTHYRTTDYEINGGKYLLIQEIQSDYFQEARKILNDVEHKEFIQKSPFSGTSNWVALAIRDSIDKIVDEGDYKGIAWLDSRMQTHLEHGYDPELPVQYFGNTLFKRFFKGGKTDITAGGTITEIRRIVPDERISIVQGLLDTDRNKDFIKLFNEGGGTGVLDLELSKSSIVSMKIGGKTIPLVEGVDYIKSRGTIKELVTFRKGLFSDDHLIGGKEFESNIIFFVKRKNMFAVFQDKIIPDAVKKQIRNNGLASTITHDKDLGFYVMDIDKKSQLLIKERGQPMYGKAVATDKAVFKPIAPSKSPKSLRKEISVAEKKLDRAIAKREDVKVTEKETKVLTSQLKDLEKQVEKFKPIAPSEAPDHLKVNQYSSLERLIKSQRPLDKRNGKQWSKYLTTQGMSLAEIKHTGIWDVLEKSKTKDIPKEKLLDAIDKKRFPVFSHEVQIDDFEPEVLEWDDVVNIKVGKSEALYDEVNDLSPSANYSVSIVQHSKGGSYSIIKGEPSSSRLSRTYLVYAEAPDMLSGIQHSTISDARHYAQQLSDETQSARPNDHRSTTIEFHHIGKRKKPKNYREVVIQLPQVASQTLDDLSKSVTQSVRNSLQSHFLRQVRGRDLDTADIIVHYRTTDYEIDGGKYLLIQEIQSDFFQKASNSSKINEIGEQVAYKEFIEKTPYSGTSHWVSLAIRDAIDKVVKEGDYKGIAWLDSRLQTHLEHGYDPEAHSRFSASLIRLHKENQLIEKNKKGYVEISSPIPSYKGSSVRIEIEGNESFIELLEGKGRPFFFQEPSTSPDDVPEFTAFNRGKFLVELTPGVDYIKARGETILPNGDSIGVRSFYVFREGIFAGVDFQDGGQLNRSTYFYRKQKNMFTVFQDKIVTDAFRKQMRNNSLKATIKHDKDLGFHVMDIDKKSQLLIKEKGQPSYAKAIPDPDFKPLEPSKAPSIIIANQYSSLERLIENQRPLDKRNGKQWTKYLIGQGMSEAEMKVTGVWNELNVNKTKEITKETLLSIIDKNRTAVNSFEVQAGKRMLEPLEWTEHRTNVRITDKEDWIYDYINSGRRIDAKIYLIQNSVDGEYGIIKIVPREGQTEPRYSLVRYKAKKVSSSSYGNSSDVQHQLERTRNDIDSPWDEFDWSRPHDN